MGAVYRARDLQLDRNVAVKFLRDRELADETARARFLREARTASALNHPNICTIHEIGEAEGQIYIAMEYVEGRPLSALASGGGLPLEEQLRYAAETAAAVAYAHAHGIIHRDLKSPNTMVTPEGRIKILDFGLAKRLTESEPSAATRSAASLTEAGAIVGTLDYIAPEILKGRPATPQSDVWALGVMMFEMATGHLPFKGQTGFELSSAILREPPAPLPPQIPPGLGAIIGRCLEKEAAARYQQAGEVHAALEAIQAGSPTAAGVRGAARERPPRKWLAQAVAAISDRRPAVGTPPLQRRRAALGVAFLVVGAVAVLLGLNVGGLRDRLRGHPASPRIESLAVLPLENLSGDPQQDYFADGMTEELITDLSGINSLRVISRTSVMQYKGTRKPLTQIARELHVDGVIEGSVLRSGDRVRITAQLIYGPTDTHLWAESYDRDLRDVLALQDEVARTIAGEIKVKLTPEEQTRLATARAVNPEAHEDYLKGRYEWNTRTEEGLKKSLDYFQHAIQLEPNYALAYSGLADSYEILTENGFLSPGECMPKAKAASLKALEIDNNLAEAHTSLAFVLQHYDWDWRASEGEYRRALELNPNYATAHHWYAFELAFLGRRAEGLAEIRKAQELDPLSPRINANVGLFLSGVGQDDQALKELNDARELNPNDPAVHAYLGLLYLQKGMNKEGIAELLRLNQLTGDKAGPLLLLARGYAIVGERDRARKMVKDLEERSKRTYVSPAEVAKIYGALGEKEKALACLEKAYQQRDSGLEGLKDEPLFDPLRSDPRFQDLLRRMHFPP